MFLPRSQKVLAAFSDERLVEQVRRGNEDAFAAIYDRHHRGILSFCRHMLSCPDEAEDAVQQTFISAYDALLSDRRDIRLKAWLYAIARNRCLSILRARREQPSELAEVPVAGLSEEVQQRTELRDLLADVRDLPVDQRAALVLSELGDLSHDEVGAIVGCEVAKVKSLVFQARSSLIESRRARDIPCQEIREQLATATGGALRRGPLRRHLRACAGCAEFRDDVMRQRRALAAVLPVLPSLGLRKAALSVIGVGGGGGGGAAVATLAGSGVALKLSAAVVVAGLAVGGGVMLDRQSKPAPAQAASGAVGGGGQAWPEPGAGTGPGAHVTLAARRQPASHRASLRVKKAPGAHAVPVNHVVARRPPAARTGTRQPSARRHAAAGAPPRASHGHAQHAPRLPHMTHHTTAPPRPAQPQPAPAPAPTPTSAPPEPSHGHHYGWGHHQEAATSHSDHGIGWGDHHGGGRHHEGEHPQRHD